jgi:putative MATE family efflux protein
MAQLATTTSGADRIVTTGSPYAVILKLASPTVLAMVTQSVVNEIDIVYFAHLPNLEASNGQAALFPSLILLWIFGGSLSAISVGTQALTARRFAERRLTDAGAVLMNAVVFAALAGVVFTLLGYLTLPYFLRFAFPVQGVREAAEGYLHWRLLGIVSMAATFAFKAFFDGIGKTHVHLVSAVVMNALNIVLCYIFIFGHFGAPHMGVPGAGFAGLISTYVGLAIMIGYAARPEYRLFRPFDMKSVARPLTWNILRLSIPSGAATIAVMTGFMIVAWIAGRLDQGSTEAINGAATTVVVGILKLTFTACLAFGTATATLVSQSLGEREPEKAVRFGWASVRLGLVIFGIVGLLEGAIATSQLLGLVTKSEAVHAAAMFPLRIMGFSTPLIAVGMILTQALFGAGNSRFVMFCELILHFCVLVPLAFLFAIVWDKGLVGIWTAAAVYVLGLSSLMTWKFAKGDWKSIRI